MNLSRSLFVFTHTSHTILYVLLFSLLMTACSNEKDHGSPSRLKETTTQLPIDSSLLQRIDAYVHKHEMDSLLAMHVYDITAGKTVFGYREDSMVPPASCMKLLTGMAAMKLLGTRFRFSTQLGIKGNITDGVLHGDLCIVGGLDPLVTSSDLQPLFRRLQSKGIKRINGHIILDLGIREYPSHEEHWIPGDLKRRKYGFFFQGEKRILQEIKYLVRSQGISCADSCFQWGLHPRQSLLIGKIQTPLSEVIRTMWKNSANEKSESLLYALGKYSGHKDSLRKHGIEYMQRFAKEELGWDKVTIHDGCGMCIYNSMSPTLLTSILRYGHQHPAYFRILQEMLPTSGTDGTLLRRLYTKNTKGKIKAKTGTLTRENGICSLAGYFYDSQKHLIAFAIMNYHLPIADAQLYQDHLCQLFVADTL